MTEIRQRESAKIYRFPAGGRDGLRAERALRSDAVDTASAQVQVVCGSSWYHDEAVLEEKASLR